MSRRYWYLYNGTGDDQLPGSYLSPTLTTPAICSAGGTSTCAIFVPAGSVFPTESSLTTNIKAYLRVAKEFGYQYYPFSTTTRYVLTRS